MTEGFIFTAPEAKKARVRRGGWSWGPVEGVKLRALSLGAGVQSTAMTLMMLHGEIKPRPDVIIFADTGDEVPATLRHLDWLEGEVTRRTNGQVKCVRVSKGERLSDSIRRRAEGVRRFVSAPFFTANGGQGRRQCTREYKIDPITREQRHLLGFAPGTRIPARSCEVWIGISTDEVVRAGAAFDRWAVNRFPLLEARMSRHDCEVWLRRHDYPVPPKSACVFCPYRSNAEWRWLRDNEPEAFAQAVEIDRLIRNTPGMHNKEFVHRDRVPLDAVDFSTAQDNGQGMLDICEGGCGL